MICRARICNHENRQGYNKKSTNNYVSFLNVAEKIEFLENEINFFFFEFLI